MGARATEPSEGLRQRLLEAAMREPEALERALDLAARAEAWLAREAAAAREVPALPAPAPAAKLGSATSSEPAESTKPEQETGIIPVPGPARRAPAAGRRPDGWAPAEDARLRELYPSGASMAEMLDELPGRSAFAIRHRAVKVLGLVRPRWPRGRPRADGAPRTAAPGTAAPLASAPTRPSETLPVLDTARAAAAWLTEQGIADAWVDDDGICWRMIPDDPDEAAERLTPRQVIALADSARGQRGLALLGDGADLVGGPHQSSLRGDL